MSAEIHRVSGNAGALPIEPAGSGAPGRVASRIAGRAIVRVTPVAPLPGIGQNGRPGSPLERSGLPLSAFLDAPDQLLRRDPPTRAGLGVGLEAARGALLRQLPVDALAMLDEVWDGAMQTEDGWYLRSGALLVLGLPTESDRVAESGMALRPSSVSLPFLQALARLARGDVAGARNSLQRAAQLAPRHPLLAALDAVVLARGGNRQEALTRLAGIRLAPDDPIMRYGAAAVRLALAELVRRRATPAQPTSAQAPPDPSIAELSNRDGPDIGHDMGPDIGHDPLLDAFCRLGTRIALPREQFEREVRALLRTLATGGTLAPMVAPDLLHTARQVLTAMVAALPSADAARPGARATAGARDGAVSGSGLHRDMAALLGRLRNGDVRADWRELARATDHLPAGMRDGVGALLRALIRGAAPLAELAQPPLVHEARGGPSIPDGPALPENADKRAPPQHLSALLRVEDDVQGAIIPVRLGLRLVSDAERSHSMPRRPGASVTPWTGGATVGASIAYQHAASMPLHNDGRGRTDGTGLGFAGDGFAGDFVGDFVGGFPGMGPGQRRREGATASRNRWSLDVVLLACSALGLVVALGAARNAHYAFALLAIACGVAFVVRAMKASRSPSELDDANRDDDGR